jgi:hypothetical protein
MIGHYKTGKMHHHNTVIGLRGPQIASQKLPGHSGAHPCAFITETKNQIAVPRIGCISFVTGRVIDHHPASTYHSIVLLLLPLCAYLLVNTPSHDIIVFA